MGSRLFNEYNVLVSKTDRLGLVGMKVVPGYDDSKHSESIYHVVHESYFKKEKPRCPYCQESDVKEKKIRERKYKDILPFDSSKSSIIDLVFHQRYFICPRCGHVFCESASFAEEKCRYTNRLSDLLADGTLTKTYEKVCKDYGVPSSKASVGIIMRRRLLMRLKELPPIETPEVLIIVVSRYYSAYYPVIFGMYDNEIRFIDILSESSQSAYSVFFSSLDKSKVKHILVDPDEQLNYSVSTEFPRIDVMVSDECILRVFREAFKDIIKKEGARCLINKRYHTLCKDKKYLTISEINRVNAVLKRRHRLHAAYEAYQDFLPIMDEEWNKNSINEWLMSLSKYIQEYSDSGEIIEPFKEFEYLEDFVELYEKQINNFVNSGYRLPVLARTKITGLLEALKEMPFCIYDVLHARIILNVNHEAMYKNGKEYRAGLSVDKLVEKMNEITRQIRSKKEMKDYGFEPEN